MEYTFVLKTSLETVSLHTYRVSNAPSAPLSPYVLRGLGTVSGVFLLLKVNGIGDGGPKLPPNLRSTAEQQQVRCRLPQKRNNNSCTAVFPAHLTAVGMYPGGPE